MRLWRKRRVPLSARLFRRFMYKYYARYLLVDLQLMAKQETLEHIRTRMRGAMLFNDRWDLLAFALARAPEQGLVLEFGVEDAAASITLPSGRRGPYMASIPSRVSRRTGREPSRRKAASRGKAGCRRSDRMSVSTRAGSTARCRSS
jgi:hypothetical protein